MTRVLTDLHHHALAESLLMLFEDRFGWEVFFPAGHEWYDEGIWRFERAYREAHGLQPDAVAVQYLEDTWKPWLGSASILDAPDPRHHWRTRKGITLDAARDLKWDYVLSSLPDNDAGLHALARDTGATFGVQVGNEAQTSRWDLAEFIMSSSALQGLSEPEQWAKPNVWRGTPAVIYHQEFSLDIFRHEWPPANRAEVASWVNCFAEMAEPYELFASLARELRGEFDFKCWGAYGSATEDEWAAGDVSDVRDIGDLMRAARIGYHGKYWSDGYGHVVHNWFAIGRPVVGVPRYYKGKLAGPLWQEGVTSLNVEAHSRHDLIVKLRKLRDDDELHRRMSEAAAARFREVVSFDAEAEAIRLMLETVRP